MNDEMGDTMMLRYRQDWLEVKRLDARGLLWLVVGGTTELAGDVVSFQEIRQALAKGVPPVPPKSPFAADTVVDSVTGAVLLPEGGKPESRLRRAMWLVRQLEAADLSDQAQMVRDWLRPTLMKDFRDRSAA
jgi:hypothetical protein